MRRCVLVLLSCPVLCLLSVAVRPAPAVVVLNPGAMDTPMLQMSGKFDSPAPPDEASFTRVGKLAPIIPTLLRLMGAAQPSRVAKSIYDICHSRSPPKRAVLAVNWRVLLWVWSVLPLSLQDWCLSVLLAVGSWVMARREIRSKEAC